MKRIKITKMISSIPKQFKRFALGSNEHLTFLFSTTKNPSHVISIHNKLGAWNPFGHKDNVNDKLSAPFKLLEKGACRRVMLRFTDDENSAEENELISNAKRAHIMGCNECFVTFSHVTYGGSQDYAFMLIVIDNMEDVLKNGIWSTSANGQSIFGADDVYGVSGTDTVDSQRRGPCLLVTTGTINQQGRVGSKIYGWLHLVGRVGMSKDTEGKIAINMKDIDPIKFEFFAKVIKKYFADFIWSREDKRNSYAKKVSDAVYKMLDSIIGVGKFYCYSPTEYNKREMRKGVRGIPSEERPELSPHYDKAKKAFKDWLPIFSSVHIFIRS